MIEKWKLVLYLWIYLNRLILKRLMLKKNFKLLQGWFYENLPLLKKIKTSPMNPLN